MGEEMKNNSGVGYRGLLHELFNFGRKSARADFWHWFRVILLILAISIGGSLITALLTQNMDKPGGNFNDISNQIEGAENLESISKIMELSGFTMETDKRGGWYVFVDFVVQLFVNTLLSLGLVSCALLVVQGDKLNWKQFFAHKERFWPLLGAYVMYLGAVIIGLLLLLVPGVIIAVRGMFYSYLVVDQGVGPIQALKTSWRITQGEFWRVLGIIIVCTGVIILGVLSLGIGLFWAIPTTIVATAYYYKKLFKQASLQDIQIEE